MNNKTTLKEMPQVIPFLKLKNSNGDDVYSIDKYIDSRDIELTISPLNPMIDIFETLTLYHENAGNICKINLSEIFVNALADSIDKKVCSQKTYDNEMRIRKNIGVELTEFDEERIVIDNDTDVKELLRSIMGSVITFRSVEDCFSEINLTHGDYEPPNAQEIKDKKEGRLLYVVGQDIRPKNI